MSRYAEWATITPENGESLAGLAGALLALAEDREHVRTIRGGTAFLVHPDVSARWTGTAAPEPAAEDKPVTRTRRKRAPRKDPS